MRFLIPILLFSSFHLFSQSAPFKFGKVDKGDLKMTVYEADTSAAAVVLGEFGQLEFYFTAEDVGYIFKKMVRVKILKKSGFEHGNIKIPYYHKNKLENITSIKAKVIAPDGSVTNLDRKDIFDEEMNEYWSSKRFTCPNLQVGSVIDYQYETKTKFIFQLPTWYFQSSIPVRWSELSMEVPERYQYVRITQGRELDIKEEGMIHRNFLIPSNNGSPGNVDLRVLQVRMVMKDAPALKKESFITTMEDYYSSIRFQLASILHPNGAEDEVLGTWDKLYRELKTDGKFGKQYTAQRNYKNMWEAASASIPNEGTPYQKAAAIHQFLTSNIEVENRGGVYTTSDLDECFSKKSAGGHEANLMLVALLREAGVDAYPLLISTRSNGKPLPLYPLMSQFNHVLALVDFGEKKTAVIDMSAPFMPIGYPAKNSLNQFGWALIDDAPQWIEIPTPDSKCTCFFQFALDEKGEMDGTFSVSATGYYAAQERKAINEEPDESHIKKWIIDEYPDASVDSISITNQDHYEETWKAKGNCKIPGATFGSNDFLYVTPITLSYLKESPFKLEDRQYPVDISYAINEQIIMNLQLPEGFNLEELPESTVIHLPEDAGLFDYRINQNGNSLQMTCKIKVNKIRFAVEEYPLLRNFFSLIEEKLGEQVVLKKG